jgi:hypothetical protein
MPATPGRATGVSRLRPPSTLLNGRRIAGGYVATAASLVKPGGLFLASTLNRTLRSLALAIVGAEYVLRWLEPGTHRWEQFVTPLELTGFARAAGLKRQSLRGMIYDPFRRVRHRRELPVRRDEAGPVEPALNRDGETEKPDVRLAARSGGERKGRFRISGDQSPCNNDYAGVVSAKQHLKRAKGKLSYLHRGRRPAALLSCLSRRFTKALGATINWATLNDRKFPTLALNYKYEDEWIERFKA